MKYNERIREIREENFLTQQKIANLLNREPIVTMRVAKRGSRLTVYWCWRNFMMFRWTISREPVT